MSQGPLRAVTAESWSARSTLGHAGHPRPSTQLLCVPPRLPGQQCPRDVTSVQTATPGEGPAHASLVSITVLGRQGTGGTSGAHRGDICILGKGQGIVTGGRRAVRGGPVTVSPFVSHKQGSRQAPQHKGHLSKAWRILAAERAPWSRPMSASERTCVQAATDRLTETHSSNRLIPTVRRHVPDR